MQSTVIAVNLFSKSKMFYSNYIIEMNDIIVFYPFMFIVLECPVTN